MYTVLPEKGFGESQTPAKCNGELPDDTFISGHSDIMDPRTYRDIPTNNVVMHGRMEERATRATGIAGRYAPETLPAIRLDLLSPEMVNEVDNAIDVDHDKSAMLRALGARTCTLPDSQIIHRGFYGMPAEMGRAIMARYADQPHTAIDIFAARDLAPAVLCDPEEAAYVAQEIFETDMTAGSIVALLALKRRVGDHSRDITILGDPCNTTDVRTFRYSARSGQIVDPAYLSSPAYDWTASPFTDPQDAYNSIRHQMIGFPGPTGNDHIYLYANAADKPNSIASALPDYSQCRPGNYLYHDLKMMEGRAAQTAQNGNTWIKNVPFEIVLDYALVNYFGGQQIDLKNLHAGTPSRNGQSLRFQMGQNLLQFPLKPVGTVIPNRVLRKGREPAKLYSSKDYLAELVDIALQIDRMHKASGRSEILPEPMHQRLLRNTASLRPAALSQLAAITQIALQQGIRPLEVSYTLF